MTLAMRLTALLGTTLLLGACQTTVNGGSGTSARSGAGHSEVQIINGTSFTATWEDRAATEVRLTFDSSVPISDSELIEVAQTITGCTATSGSSEPLLLGSIATVRVPVSCGQTPQAA